MFGKKRALLNGLIIVVLLMGTLTGYGVQRAKADGGAYSINFSAADPVLYIPPIPFPETHPSVTGRQNGETLIPGAWYTQPGGTKTSIESLNPRQMALCQIVPFEIRISVGAGAEVGDDPITFKAGWSTVTTNNGLFGYDPTYGVYAAFVDTGDGSYNDPGEDASVSHTWTVVGDEIQGTFTVTGLDAGDVVVVEPWLVLDCVLPPKVGGNVQSRLISARTATGDTINTGNQTVPLLKVDSLNSVSVDVAVTKTDGDYIGIDVDGNGTIDKPRDPYLSYAPPNNVFWYMITVTNYNADSFVANGVIVTDTLDPNLTPNLGELIISPLYSRECEYVAPTITCYLGAMADNEVTTILFPVTIGPDTPTTFLKEVGTCTQDPAEADICNLVSVSTISDDTNPANDSDSEPTDIGFPTAVDVHSFSATAQAPAILLEWDTVGETKIIGFNLYRTTDPDGESGLAQLNQSLIEAVHFPTSDGGHYEYLDQAVEYGVTYHYKLEVIYSDLSTGELKSAATLWHYLFLPVTVK